MEKRKTIEEYERLAETLSEARDAASDVANRALRENQALKQELRPLVERLLGAGQPGQDQRTKQERDHLLTFVSEMSEVLTGLMSIDEFQARAIGRSQQPNALLSVVASRIVVLIQDANRYRHQLNEALSKLPNPRPKAKRQRAKAKRKRR